MSGEKTPYDRLMDSIGALLAGQKSNIQVMKSIESRMSSLEGRVKALEDRCYNVNIPKDEEGVQ